MPPSSSSGRGREVVNIPELNVGGGFRRELSVVPPEMVRLSLLPTLMALCADLLLQKPSSLAFPVSQHYSSPQQQQHQQQQAGPEHRTSHKIFHPPTGSCVVRKSLRDPLTLGPCARSDDWGYTPQKFLMAKGTYFCLQAAGPGKPAKLGIVCTEADSGWEVVPGVKPRLATELPGGAGSLCLDVDSDGVIVTNPCGGGGDDSQWFDLVAGQRRLPAGDAVPATTPLLPDAQ